MGSQNAKGGSQEGVISDLKAYAPAINDTSVPLHQRLRDHLLPKQGEKVRKAQESYRALADVGSSWLVKPLAAATRLFEACLQGNPADHPTNMLRELCRELIHNLPPPELDGVFEFESK